MNNEKQHQAKNLYFQTDLTKTQIAGLLNVSRRSLHYWIRENNWDRLKRSANHLPAMLAENCYMIINQFTESLISENRVMRPITHLEAETLHKLTLAVRKLKNHSTLNESMEMFAHFMERVNKESPALADQLMPFVNGYMEDRARLNLNQFKPEKLNGQGFIPIPNREDPDEQQQQATAEIQQDFDDFMAWEQERNNTSIEPMIEALRKKEEEEKNQALNEIPPQDGMDEATTSCVTPPSPLGEGRGEALPAPVPSAEAIAKEGSGPSPDEIVGRLGAYATSPSPSERVGERSKKPRMTFNEMLEASNGDEQAMHDMIDALDELSEEEIAHRKALLDFGKALTQKYPKRPAA